MKERYSFELSFPYSQYTSSFGYSKADDVIENFSMEEIENTWNIEFFYPNGKLHSYYEDNKWWSNDEIHADFLTVDGKVDLERPALYKGKPLKLNHTYTFECTIDSEIRCTMFSDKIISAKLKR